MPRKRDGNITKTQREIMTGKIENECYRKECDFVEAGEIIVELFEISVKKKEQF